MSRTADYVIALFVLLGPATAFYLIWGRRWERTARTVFRPPRPEEAFLLSGEELDEQAMREASDALDEGPLIPTRPGPRDATFRALEDLWEAPAHDREGDAS